MPGTTADEWFQDDDSTLSKDILKKPKEIKDKVVQSVVDAKDKVAYHVNKAYDTAGRGTDKYFPTFKNLAKKTLDGTKKLGGVAGMGGAMLSKATSGSGGIATSESKKYQYIFWMGIIIHLVAIFFDIGSGGFRSAFLFANILLLLFSLDILGPLALLAGVLTFFHVEIMTMAGIGLNKFFLPMYWPWWALFSYYTKSTKEKGFSMAVARIAIVYFIVFGLISSGLTEGITQIGQSDDIDSVREDQLEKTKEEILTPWHCTTRSLFYGENYYECINPPEKKEESMKGKESDMFEPLVFKIKKSLEYPAGSITDIDPDSGFKITLEHKSRVKDIPVKMSCQFIPTEKSKETIQGSVSTYTDFSIKKSEDKTEIEITCIPNKRLNKGRYNVEFKSTISDLSTTSILPRVFVGDMKKQEDKDQTIKDLIDTSYPESNQNGVFVPVVPSGDFAFLNFFIGNPSSYALISNKKNPVDGNIELSLSYSALNKENGKIMKIDRMQITLIDGIIKKSEEECGKFKIDDINSNILYIDDLKGNFTTIKKGKTSPIGTCKLKIDLESDAGKALVSANKIPIDFMGKLTYTYEMKEKFLIRVLFDYEANQRVVS